VGFSKKSGTIPARLANRFDRKIKPLDGFRPVGLEKTGDRPCAVGLGNACFVCVDDGRFDPQYRLRSGLYVLAPFPGCGSGRDSLEVALALTSG
jgi:hypothetical protein